MKMFSRKKTQADLDAAFLEAVSKHKFAKAKKLLEAGANVHAVDAKGNTALHKLSGYCPNGFDTDHLKRQDLVKEFVCLLINQNVDMNCRNGQGQTCLHRVADARSKYHVSNADMMDLLIKQGALINVQDNAGKTPLHIAALRGMACLINGRLSSLAAIADNDGKWPHNYAAAGGYNVLSLELLDKCCSLLQAEEKPAAPEPPPAPQEQDWILLTPVQAAHVTVQKAIGYKLTEIFDFHARIYTKIVHNLETKADAPLHKDFDDFSDKTLLVDAWQELRRMDGKADESSIHSQGLNKGTNLLLSAKN